VTYSVSVTTPPECVISALIVYSVPGDSPVNLYCPPLAVPLGMVIDALREPLIYHSHVRGVCPYVVLRSLMSQLIVVSV
jgi:hypothetical protein